MKLKHCTTFLFCLLSAILIGQDVPDFDLIVNNSISKIQGYNISLKDGTVQTLKTIESFNLKGKRTSIRIFNDHGSVSEYQYHYKDDTILHQRLTFFDGQLHSKTTIKYDEKGREIETIDEDAEGKPTGTFTKTKYKKGGKIKESKIYIKNKLSKQTKEVREPNKDNVRNYQRDNNKWSQRDNSNIKTETITNYKGTKLTLQKKLIKIQKPQILLGIIDPISLKENDELIIEKYIEENGLIDKEIQYLNAKLIAKKKYRYVSLE